MTYRATYASPLGAIFLRSDGDAFTGLWFEGSRDERKHARQSEERPLAIFDETRHWFDIYFSGKQPDFTPLYCLPNATPFRHEVSDAMCRIPFGATDTYGIKNKIALLELERNDMRRFSVPKTGRFGIEEK